MLHRLAVVLLATLLPAQDPPAAKPATPAPAASAGELDEKAFAALHDLKQEKSPSPTGSSVEVGGQRHYLSLPKNRPAPLPAVLLVHEWWGLNDHVKHWADRLAAEGYATLAVDLYGGKVATTREEASALMQGVDAAAAQATLAGAFAFLRADPRVQATKVGSLGWCFGGGWSLQLATTQPKLDACVLYYGRLVEDPALLQQIKAPVLGVFGTRDPSIPQAKVSAFEQAMQKAGKQCRVLRYDAEHAFANPSNPRYDQPNAAKAWTEVRAFLRQHLAAESGTAPPAPKTPQQPVK